MMDYFDNRESVQSDVNPQAIPIAPRGIPIISTPREKPNPDDIRPIAGNMRPFTITTVASLATAPNVALDVGLGFAASAVIIQNPTPYWWLIPNAPLWIPPWTVNLAYNFPSPTEKASVLFLAPADAVQPAIAIATAQASFTYVDTPQIPTTLIHPGNISATIAGPNPLPVQDARPSAGAATSVAASIVNTTLLAANANRKGASIFNDDAAATIYVKFGATASASSFKIAIGPGGYFEFPHPCYTGIVDAIWSAATGNARISEET